MFKNIDINYVFKQKMSYTTPPPANRIGIIQGWSNQLLSNHTNLSHVSFNVYLKSYMLLQEYLRFYDVNLLFFEIKTLTNNNKLVNILIYNNNRQSSILYDKDNQITSLRKKNQAKFKTYYSFSKNLLKFKSKNPNERLLYKQYRLKHFFETFFHNHLKKFYLYSRKTCFWKPKNLEIREQKVFVNFNKKADLNFKIKNKINYFRKASFLPKKKHQYVIKKFKKNKFTFKKVFWKRMRHRRFRKMRTYLKEWKRAIYASLRRTKKTYRWKFKTKKRYKKRFYFKKYEIKTYFRPFKRSQLMFRKKIQQKIRHQKKTFLWKFRNFWRKINWLKIKLRRTRYWNRKKLWEQRPKNKKKIKIARKKNFKVNKKKLNKKVQIRKKYKIHNKRFRVKKWIARQRKLATILAKLKKKRISIKKKQFRFSLKKKEVRLFRKQLKKAFKYSKLLWTPTTAKTLIKKTFHRILVLLTIRHHYRLKNPFFKVHSSQPIFFKYMVWKQRIKFFPPNNYKPLQLFSAEYIFIKHFNKINKLSQLCNHLWRMLLCKKQMSKILIRLKIKRKKNKFIRRRKRNKIIFDTKQNKTYYDHNSKKIHLHLKLFIEKHFENISNVPVFAKIKNIADYSNLFTKQKQRKFKKKLFLKRFHKNDFFWKVLSIVVNTQKYMFPQILADFLATELTFDRKHRRLLRNFKLIFSAFRSDHIMGYKILVDGKLNGVMKTTKQVLKLQNKEKVPVQTFDKKISYALGVSRTFAGLFGVHVWLYY